MTPPRSSKQDGLKRMAAERAIEQVEEGMILGLGSGSTAAFAVEALAWRIAKGLRDVGIPTSETTAALARRLGLPLTSFAEHRHVDVSIEGADQVERSTLNLIKGLGGALLSEKIVASAGDWIIVVVDETKLVDRLGGGTPLPVEIVSFGWQTVLDRLAAIGCRPRLRLAGGQPFTTDSGNHIAHCAVAEIPDQAALETRLSAIVGVVESGLFVGLASKVVVGRSVGVARRTLGSSASIARSQAYYLDVTPAATDKGVAVAGLARRLGIPAAGIATIGDMENDVPMFGQSGFSVAMGNTSPEVKRRADAVTLSNEEDGFATAVDRLILPRARGAAASSMGNYALAID